MAGKSTGIRPVLTKRIRGAEDLPHPGCTREGARTVFCTAAKSGEEAVLVLLSKDGKSELYRGPLRADPLTGDLRTAAFEDLPDGCLYYFEIDGKKVQDPYARLFHHGIAAVPSRDEEEKEEQEFLFLPTEELMIYKLHVRGFTMKKAGLGKKRGTFAGLLEQIPYIASLGFNAVELMPVYEFDETLKVQPYQAVQVTAQRAESGRYVHEARALRNYWGYAERNHYFAPKESYAATSAPDRELKELVAAFHAAGIEVYMEIYLPYGTDLFLIRDALWMWRLKYRMDGFHLIGSVPFTELSRDPVLGSARLFYDNPDPWQLFGGELPKTRHIYSYRDEFQNNLRALLKGDEGQTGPFAAHFRENPPSVPAVHYAANHNGFTLLDTVSYDWKHNEANGEDNADGSAANFSWNCGVEGPTRKKAVHALRMRQIRNALLYTFLSQGVPLLYAGDECLNTQDGNNNAYAMDNETGWVSWKNTKDAGEMRAFTAALLSFRKAHPVFHMEKELRGSDYRNFGIPDISFHSEKAWVASFENTARTLAILLNGRYTLEEGKKEDDLFYVIINAHWEARDFDLPVLPDQLKWHPAIDSSVGGNDAFSDGSAEALSDQKTITVMPRTVVVLKGCAAQEASGRFLC